MVADQRSVEDLAEVFGVSASTIRRDLRALAADSKIVRTLGGAVTAQRLERSWHDKTRVEASAKTHIAQAAVPLVPDGAVVFIDAGTSAAALAARLADNPTVTLVTNGLSAAVAVADGRAALIVLGGKLRRPTAGMTGMMTVSGLDLVHPHIAFLGCEALDPVLGVNCPDVEVAAFKRRLMAQCQQSWVLADHTKFDTTSAFPYWAGLGTSTGVITDSVSATGQATVLEDLRARGHDVIVA